MKISTLISPDDIVIRSSANSKKQLLQDMTHITAGQKIALDEREVLEALLERERLGSTGIGKGIAIPHARCSFPNKHPAKLVGLLMKLNKPIDFDASDSEPVDIIFMLLASRQTASEHLTALTSISSALQKHKTVTAIREALTADEIWAAINKTELSTAA